MENGKWKMFLILAHDSNPFTLSLDSLHFCTNPSGKHQPNHFVVAHERPQWMLKGSGPVLFNEEVSDPGGAITGNQPQKKQPPASGRDQEHDARDSHRGSKQVE